MTLDLQKINSLAEYLGKDYNQARIKKLIFCACRNQWENNLSVLDKIDFSTLVLELYERNSTLEKLNLTLIEIVKKINKKSMYFMLANKTLKSLRTVYPNSYSPLNEVHIYLKKNNHHLKYQNLFNLHFLVDLKFTISRKTSLSQSKSLIYSALHSKFRYTIEDLNLLNHQEFDDLVKRFLYDCDTIEDIDFRLQGAANYLENPQKNIEVAETIVRSIQRFYDYLRQQDRDNIFLMEETEEDRDEQTFALQTNDLEVEEKPPSDLWVSQLLPPAIEPGSSEPSEKDWLALQKNIQEMTQGKIEWMNSNIESILQELETQLEQSVEDTRSEGYLLLKYKVLRDFLQGLQSTSTKYLGVLQTLEQNDRQKLSASGSLTQEP